LLLHCRELRLLLGWGSSCGVAPFRDQANAHYETDSAGGDEDVSS
jgi:hypothetical protein